MKLYEEFKLVEDMWDDNSEDTEYTSCDWCDDEIEADSAHEAADGKLYCDDCWDAMATPCDKCKNKLLIKQLKNTLLGTVCPTCYASIKSDPVVQKADLFVKYAFGYTGRYLLKDALEECENKIDFLTELIQSWNTIKANEQFGGRFQNKFENNVFCEGAENGFIQSAAWCGFEIDSNVFEGGNVVDHLRVID